MTKHQAMTKLIVVDDHPLVREAICGVVRAELPAVTILEAGSVDEACQAMRQRTALDLIIFDLLLPDVSGLDGLMTIRSHYPHIPILVFSALEDTKIAAEAIALGAAGYVPKSAGRIVLIEAIAAVLRGEAYVTEYYAGKVRRIEPRVPVKANFANRVCSLTRSEIKVLQLVRRGLLNKQIAYELGISETTVKAHVTAILRKLNVVSRTQIVIETSNLDFDAILKSKAGCDAAEKDGDGYGGGRSQGLIEG
jgi:DNA-binding NarL/FixJ family response regulator